MCPQYFQPETAAEEEISQSPHLAEVNFINEPVVAIEYDRLTLEEIEDLKEHFSKERENMLIDGEVEFDGHVELNMVEEISVEDSQFGLCNDHSYSIPKMFPFCINKSK